MATVDKLLDVALRSYMDIFGTALGNIQVLDMTGSNAILSIHCTAWIRTFLDTLLMSLQTMHRVRSRLEVRRYCGDSRCGR